MKFIISSSENSEITDQELSELLRLIYVAEGYTPEKLAETVFKPVLVRARGTIYFARHKPTGLIAGMVIVVPSDSKACVIAGDNECEMHLLGVKSEFRGAGLGKLLVTAILEHATKMQWSKMLLWTQTDMHSAQRLYQSCGFARTGKMLRNEINFIIYEKTCPVIVTEL